MPLREQRKTTANLKVAATGSAFEAQDKLFRLLPGICDIAPLREQRKATANLKVAATGSSVLAEDDGPARAVRSQIA